MDNSATAETISAATSSNFTNDDSEVPKTGQDISIESKLKELFNEEIVTAFRIEDLISEEAIKDLMGRDADAPIFQRLKLTYGKALAFKAEFGKIFPIVVRKTLKPVKQVKHKPKLEEMAAFTAQQRTDYNVKRRRVSDLAASHWPGIKPKFTSPQMKGELREFATQIAPKCEMLEVGFNVDAIMEHVKDYFSEQRRYAMKKNKKKSSEDPNVPRGQLNTSESSVNTDSDGSTRVTTPPSSKMRYDTSGPKSAATTSPPVHDDESLPATPSTVSLYDSEQSEPDDSDLFSCSQIVVNYSPPKEKLDLTVQQAQMVLKAVFGKIPNRDEQVKVLRNKFKIKQNNLTSLTVSQLTDCLAKKVLNNKYCTIKDGVDLHVSKLRMDNITVHKEISLLITFCALSNLKDDALFEA